MSHIISPVSPSRSPSLSLSLSLSLSKDSYCFAFRSPSITTDNIRAAITVCLIWHAGSLSSLPSCKQSVIELETT